MTRLTDVPYSAPFTTDVPQCCGEPETCNDPCVPVGAERARAVVPEQQARFDEGYRIVEWEYPDGSGGWGYCEPADALDIASRKRGCRVWLDGVDLGALDEPSTAPVALSERSVE